MSKRVITLYESESGRNERFYDKKLKKQMNRNEFVKKIQEGEYPGYHIRVINEIATPCSNPDKSKKNNLG